MGKDSEAKMSTARIDKGFVSLLMLMIITFLSGVGYVSYYKASSEEKMIRYEAHRIKAVYLADSGLEWAMSSISKDPSWEGGSKLFGDGKIEVTVEKNSQGYKVISRSKYNETSQSRYGYLIADSNGGLVLSGYGEQYN